MSDTQSSVLIVNGTVVNRTGDTAADVLVENGRVARVAPGISGSLPSEAQGGPTRVDASGCLVSSSFVDLHTHMREPGREESETIATASRAAALGGFGAVVAMPNTDPAQDNVAVVEFVRMQGQRAGVIDVSPSACITVGRNGTQLAPFHSLAAAGVRLYTDDGNGVQDPLIMRRALEYARELDITLAQHCEVSRLTDGAVMNEGCCSSRLGLPGWPAIAEVLMLQRDIELVRETGAKMHFLHLSTARSVEIVRQAKNDGLPVTAEVTPHHISLTDERLATFSAIYKVNPPLRTMEDVEALRAGLLDGTIDAIATDHAPHAPHTKDQDLAAAPPGMLGLQTALGVAIGHSGCAPRRVIELMSWAPAAIAGLSEAHGGDIAEGRAANLVVFDPVEKWQQSVESIVSKSVNTPYLDVSLTGKVRHVLYQGRIVVNQGGLV
jgi:dihydroorotase